MNFYGFLWISLDTCIDFYGFVWKKSNHKPIFDELGLKEPYFVYWLCFRLGLVDCNPQLRNICIKEILGFYGRCCQNFSKTHVFVLAIT